VVLKAHRAIQAVLLVHLVLRERKVQHQQFLVHKVRKVHKALVVHLELKVQLVLPQQFLVRRAI
jgi:hypothetical protein